MTAEERLEHIRRKFLKDIQNRASLLKETHGMVPVPLAALLAHAEAGDDEFWEWVEYCPGDNFPFTPPVLPERGGRVDDKLLARAVQKPGPAPEPRSGRSADQQLPSPRRRGGEHDDP